MESFLAFSKKCISASAGVIPLIRKKVSVKLFWSIRTENEEQLATVAPYVTQLLSLYLVGLRSPTPLPATV